MSETRIPLSVPYLRGNEGRYLQECLASGWVSSAGPWVNRFEKEFAAYLGTMGAVSVSSGTAALHLALLVAGVQSGDEVIVPTLTFIATANAARYLGAEPVFMDCDSHLGLDLTKLERFLSKRCQFTNGVLRNRATGRRIAAIVPVHIFGHLVDVDQVMRLAEPLGVKVIEDATESLGSQWADGPENRASGTRGHFGCFSFNGNKIITTGGGGMVVSRSPAALARIKHLSTQAKVDELFFEHDEVGYNYRLTSLQAALGIAQLEQLPKILEAKKRTAATYQELLATRGLGDLVREPKGTHSNYWLCALRLARPVDLRSTIRALAARQIDVRPIWMLNHNQPPFKKCEAWEVDRATQEVARVLQLPSSADLTQKDIARVVDALDEVLKTGHL